MESREKQLKIPLPALEKPMKSVAFTGHRDIEKYPDFSVLNYRLERLYGITVDKLQLLRSRSARKNTVLRSYHSPFSISFLIFSACAA